MVEKSSVTQPDDCVIRQPDEYGHRVWALPSHHVWSAISLSLPSREEIEARYGKGLNPKPSLFIPNSGFMALRPSSSPCPEQALMAACPISTKRECRRGHQRDPAAQPVHLPLLFLGLGWLIDPLESGGALKLASVTSPCCLWRFPSRAALVPL